jgi:2-dehydro-3-deoxyphosphogalactonate aldolase
MNLKMWLERSPLIAILRGVKPSEVESIGAALEEAGIAIIEVPLNSPKPLKSIEILSRSFGDRLLVGAGTLMHVSDVESVASAGGKVVVTPHADVAIVQAAKAAGLIAIPGFFNPTEAFALLHAGADGIKLFPADVLGPGMLQAMRAVLPKDAIVIPVGGVGVTQIPKWLSAGAQGFGVGSSLYRPGDSPQSVKAKAKALVESLRIRSQD